MVTKVVLAQINQDLRYRFYRRILGRDPVWPWMKPREVEIVLDLLRQLRPKRILEWGAGYGTLYFTRAYSEFDTWLSIEHLQEWAGKLDGWNPDPESRSSILGPIPLASIQTNTNPLPAKMARMLSSWSTSSIRQLLSL